MIDAAPQLDTDRLILRAHRVDDFAAVAAMWADAAVVRYISGAPSSGEDSWSRLLRYAGHWRLLGFGYWAVETRETSKFVGEVGFADFKRDIVPSLDGRPEAGWVLNAQHHGRGYASEAMGRITQWADEVMDWPSTVCIVHPEYEPSIRVAQKAGYRVSETVDYRGGPTLVMQRARYGS